MFVVFFILSSAAGALGWFTAFTSWRRVLHTHWMWLYLYMILGTVAAILLPKENLSEKPHFLTFSCYRLRKWCEDNFIFFISLEWRSKVDPQWRMCVDYIWKLCFPSAPDLIILLCATFLIQSFIQELGKLLYDHDSWTCSSVLGKHHLPARSFPLCTRDSRCVNWPNYFLLSPPTPATSPSCRPFLGESSLTT